MYVMCIFLVFFPQNYDFILFFLPFTFLLFFLLKMTLMSRLQFFSQNTSTLFSKFQLAVVKHTET